MGVFWYVVIFLHAVFSVQYVIFRLRLKATQLKYLFEPNVNFMSKCRSAARYDAIHVDGWKSIIGGALLTPIRLLGAIVIVLILLIFEKIFLMITGSKPCPAHLTTSDLGEQPEADLETSAVHTGAPIQHLPPDSYVHFGLWLVHRSQKVLNLRLHL